MGVKSAWVVALGAGVAVLASTAGAKEKPEGKWFLDVTFDTGEEHQVVEPASRDIPLPDRAHELGWTCKMKGKAADVSYKGEVACRCTNKREVRKIECNKAHPTDDAGITIVDPETNEMLVAVALGCDFGPRCLEGDPMCGF